MTDGPFGGLVIVNQDTSGQRRGARTPIELTKQDRRAEPVPGSVPFTDLAPAGPERSPAAAAFDLLPERWQAVLWHTEVEGRSPAEVAPLLGLTPNGVTALAYRAREGLRQAYLQVHLQDVTDDRCRAVVDRLGARSGLSKRERLQIEAHLDGCTRCRTMADELADVNAGLCLRIPVPGSAPNSAHRLVLLAAALLLAVAIALALILGGDQRPVPGTNGTAVGSTVAWCTATSFSAHGTGTVTKVS